jgi:hypothetical protein
VIILESSVDHLNPQHSPFAARESYFFCMLLGIMNPHLGKFFPIFAELFMLHNIKKKNFFQKRSLYIAQTGLKLLILPALAS